MERVGVRELRRQASTILPRVVAGETVERRTGSRSKRSASAGRRRPSCSSGARPLGIVRRRMATGRPRSVISALYRDTSAFAKLIVDEPESEALRSFLAGQGTRRVSSSPAEGRSPACGSPSGAGRPRHGSRWSRIRSSIPTRSTRRRPSRDGVAPLSEGTALIARRRGPRRGLMGWSQRDSAQERERGGPRCQALEANRNQPPHVLVGARGFEPPTSASRTLRATKLRHAPTAHHAGRPDDTRGRRRARAARPSATRDQRGVPWSVPRAAPR